MLFRHVYRQERFWSDLADKQPENEQHACLTQFLGIAESLFSAQYGLLVEKRKEALALQARRDAYMDTLHQVTMDIGRFSELSVAVTHESLASSRARLEAERNVIGERRIALLRSLAHEVGARNPAEDRAHPSAVEQYGAQLAERRALLESLTGDLVRLARRTQELTEYRRSVASELDRLDRAKVAGEALVHLKVTHCPVCDQRLDPPGGSAQECYLCHREYEHDAHGAIMGSKRLVFEVEQLRAEAGELEELLARQEHERAQLEEGRRVAQEDIVRLGALLRPTQAAAAAILPPDLTLFDQEAGRLEEQLRTLNSISRALDQRDALTTDIETMSAEAQALEAAVSTLTESVAFERVNSVLADGFNTYFNALNTDDPSRWPEDPVKVKIRGRQFALTLGDADWRPKLGATYACFFLNAYHYALLNLSGREGFNYPGLAIIDFPPTLADGNELTDEENYLVEPFIALAQRLQPVRTQIIVAGRAFVDLAGASRIELEDVWR